MASLSFSQALTANQLGFNPLSGWQYEYVPYPAQITLLVRATGVSSRVTAYTGSETVQERSPIQGGGTAGTTPSPLNTTPLTWQAAAGDRLKLAIDEVSGLTPTVDGYVEITPLI